MEEKPVDKVLFWLTVVVFFVFVILAVFVGFWADEILGISIIKLIAGSGLSVILIIAAWVVVLWFRRRGG